MRKPLILVGMATFMVSSTSGLANDKVAKEKVVRYAFEDEALDPVTSPVLEKFSGEGEFTRYRKKLEAIKNKSHSDWASNEEDRTSLGTQLCCYYCYCYYRISTLKKNTLRGLQSARTDLWRVARE